MPIAQADAASTLVGVPITITVLSNDSGGALTVAGYSQPIFGTVVLNADQSFTYTPTAGFEGNDGFAYTVRDPIGGAASAEVTIAVTRANAAPIAAGDTAELPAGDSVAVPVLANDNDPDGDVFGIIGIDAPGHGTIQVEPDQKIRYTAEPGFSGIDSFSYTIGDGRGGAGTASVTVTVVARNTPPVAAADLVSTASGTPVSIDALANDNDPDGGPISLAGMSLPGHGSLTLTPEQRFVYTPDPGFVGTDGFAYTIRDESGAAATGEVSVAVERRNAPPVATPDSATSSGLPVTLDLLANDNDLDGDALRLAALTVPIQGQIAVGTDGRVTYTPPAGFAGSDTFTYQVSDGIEATEAEATITVTGATPPTYANGYTFRRRLLIPAASVSGTVPIADYIMLVDETLGAGKVTSALGNDIRFETTAGGKLDHELDTFTSATGRLVAWVRIPSLPADAATQILLYYGKLAAAAEANAVGVWRNYLAVWNARTGADRTGQGHTLTPTAVGTGTLIGGAGSYNGTSSKAAIATQPWANGLSALTVETVVRATAASVTRGILSAGPGSATADTALGLALSYQNPGRVAGAANTIAFKLGTTGGAAYVEAAANVQSTAAQCVAGVWASGQLARLYVDGAQTVPSNTPAAVTGTTQVDVAGWLSLGWSPVTGFWSGAIDEVRIRASATPEATLRTQALNYLTPTLFYGIGAEDTATIANQSPVAAPIQINVPAGTSTDIDVAMVGVEPDGQSMTASVPSQPDRGTTAIVVNKVRYTAPATGGVIGTAPFTLSDGLKSSSSIIRARVSSTTTRSGLPWRSGTTPGGSSTGSANAFGTWRGRAPDAIMTYSGGPYWGKGTTALATADLQWQKMLTSPNERPGGVVEDAINSGILVCHALAMVVSQEEQDFVMIKNGGRDTEHETIAGRIAAWYNAKPSPPELVLCFGQESNIRSSNYPWSFLNYASPTDYIAAWRRVRDIYKAAIPRAKFSFNVLRNAGNYNTYYPANGAGFTNYVDYITLDCYDNGDNGSYFTNTGLAGARAWVNGNFDANGFAGARGCYNFAKAKGKQFGIQEWGPSRKNNNDGTIAASDRNPNNVHYMQAMWEFFNDPLVTPWLAFEMEFNQIAVDHQIYPNPIPELAVVSAEYRRLWTP